MFTMTETYAPAVLKRAGRQWSWEVSKCPLCGRKHTHGGGAIGKHNPDDLLGHRVAHCLSGSNNYTLVRDPDGDHDNVEEAEAIMRRAEVFVRRYEAIKRQREESQCTR